MVWAIGTNRGSYEGDSLKQIVTDIAESIIDYYSFDTEPTITEAFFCSNINEHYVSDAGLAQLQKASDRACEAAIWEFKQNRKYA